MALQTANIPHCELADAKKVLQCIELLTNGYHYLCL